MKEQMMEKMKVGMAMCPMCEEMKCQEMMGKMKAGGDPMALCKEMMEKMAGMMEKMAGKAG